MEESFDDFLEQNNSLYRINDKLLHRRIPTNKFLNIMKVKSKKSLQFLPAEISHFFGRVKLFEIFEVASISSFYYDEQILQTCKVDAVGLNSKPENIYLGLICKLAAYSTANPNISELLKI